MSEPRHLTDDTSRKMARYSRDRQWRFMSRIVDHGTLWFCVWNKRHLDEKPDEWRDCLISGMEILEWMNRHPDWFVNGEWNDDRYAFPVQLTDAGRAALHERQKYDMEPVFGGLVEPGWQAIPWPAENPD